MTTLHIEHDDPALLDELTFRSYRHNRTLGITPEGFMRMGFPRVSEMEKRFQLERIQSAERQTRNEEVDNEHHAL